MSWCSGAIGLARIPNVVYGAKNQKFGAAGSLYDILTDERLNHRVEVKREFWKMNAQLLCRTFLEIDGKNNFAFKMNRNVI